MENRTARLASQKDQRIYQWALGNNPVASPTTSRGKLGSTKGTSGKGAVNLDVCTLRDTKGGRLNQP